METIKPKKRLIASEEETDYFCKLTILFNQKIKINLNNNTDKREYIVKNCDFQLILDTVLLWLKDRTKNFYNLNQQIDKEEKRHEKNKI